MLDIYDLIIFPNYNLASDRCFGLICGRNSQKSEDVAADFRVKGKISKQNAAAKAKR